MSESNLRDWVDALRRSMLGNETQRLPVPIPPPARAFLDLLLAADDNHRRVATVREHLRLQVEETDRREAERINEHNARVITSRPIAIPPDAGV